MLWTSLWRHGHLRACMGVCFGDEEGFVRKDKGFNAACMPVCVVVCRINRQQLWFILYSQCRDPLYLTGKVKAYSLEAVLQRSTCSLGMRNRTIERHTEKICPHLLSPACLWHPENTHCTVCSKGPAVYILWFSLSYLPCLLLITACPQYLQYHMP